MFKMEEDVLQQEGWISCQNLLEETGEEERTNHLFKRRVSLSSKPEKSTQNVFQQKISIKIHRSKLDPKKTRQ